MRLVTVIVIWLVGVSPALAERITDDAGGLIDTYVQRFDRIRDAGERVVVDGQCLSACTLVLAEVPRERICVTPKAVFGFHSAWSYDGQGGEALDQQATRSMLVIYPERIREWIRAHGGLHRQLIYLRGRQLAAMYPTCLPGLDRGGQPERAQAPTSRVRYAGRARHAARHALSAMRQAGKPEHAAASAFGGWHDGPPDRRWHR